MPEGTSAPSGAREWMVEIRQYPDPVLRKKTRPVRMFDEALARTAAEMVRAMRAAAGLGLAATQVGLAERMAIITTDDQPGHETVIVNPEITRSEGWQESDEGCLSLPGIYIKIGRFARIRLKYQDLEGRAREMDAEDLLARAVQHELDHLDGRLLVDRMSPVQKMAHRRRLKELANRFKKREEAAGKPSDVK